MTARMPSLPTPSRTRATDTSDEIAGYLPDADSEEDAADLPAEPVAATPMTTLRRNRVTRRGLARSASVSGSTFPDDCV